MLSFVLALFLSAGCVNQGTDSRLFGKFGCAIQRALSFKSAHLPTWLIKHEDKASDVVFGFSFPLYVVAQHQGSDGRWSRFYFGFRYDTGWTGYIAAAELKLHQQNPLPKGY